MNIHFLKPGLITLASVLLLTACGNKTDTPQVSGKASESQLESKAPVAPKAHDPALWLVRDDDTNVYLFGTVHVLKPDMKWETEKFNKAFEASDVIYQEANLGPEVQQKLGALVPALAFYSDGRTLSNVLDADDEKEVQEAGDIVGLPMISIDRMKPWFAAVALVQMQMVKAGYSADSGVEKIVTAKAEAAGKKMRYLETAEQQLRFLAEMPEEHQIAFLVSGAEAIEDDPGALDRLVTDWAEGDVAGIGEMISSVNAMGDRYVYDVMLTKRNATWTKKIRTLMDEEAGTFFIAVGAAHLAGNDSVIHMLEDAGETVIRR